MRQLAANCRRKKRDAGKKAAGSLLRQGRAVVAWKVSGLGEDFSDSGSAGTAENQGRQTKSEVVKREANEAWEEMKKGRAPAGYILVRFILSFVLISTDNYGRRTTAIDAQSHPGSWGATAALTF